MATIMVHRSSKTAWMHGDLLKWWFFNLWWLYLGFYSNTKNNPCYVINRFINKNRSTSKIEKISNNQIFIKKII